MPISRATRLGRSSRRAEPAVSPHRPSGRPVRVPPTSVLTDPRDGGVPDTTSRRPRQTSPPPQPPAPALGVQPPARSTPMRRESLTSPTKTPRTPPGGGSYRPRKPGGAGDSCGSAYPIRPPDERPSSSRRGISPTGPWPPQRSGRDLRRSSDVGAWKPAPQQQRQASRLPGDDLAAWPRKPEATNRHQRAPPARLAALRSVG